MSLLDGYAIRAPEKRPFHMMGLYPLSPYQSAQNPVSTSYMMLYVFLGLVSPIEQARDIYQLP